MAVTKQRHANTPRGLSMAYIIPPSFTTKIWIQNLAPMVVVSYEFMTQTNNISLSFRH